MEKVQKIREEVERIQLYTQSEVLKQVLDYIDEVQKEPVSNPTPNEKMSVERWKKVCEAACCDINYRSHYGLTETRDDYFVDGVQWADEHPKEEPVSKDLEVASKEWLSSQLDKSYANYGESKMMELTHFDGYAMLDAIEFGANWQKAKDQHTIELAEYHAYFAGRTKTIDEIKEKLLSEVLPCFMHGGEADEAVAKLDEVLNQKK